MRIDLPANLLWAFLFGLAVTIVAPRVQSDDFTLAGGESSVNTGSFDYNVPLNLPPLPGRLAFGLTVGYSDRREAGLFGSRTELLGIPNLRRCGPSITRGDYENKPVTVTSTDRLCLDGNQLKAVDGEYWKSGTTYRTASESYTRVTSQPGGFKVEYRNGNIAYLTYGIRPTDGTRAYAWYAERITDRYGNEILIDYKERTTYNGISISATEALPEKIRYGHVHVDFTYSDAVDIERYIGLSKGAIRRNRAIRQVSINIANTPVRKYEFSYASYSVPSRNLAKITECGTESFGATNWVCAEVATFDWQPYANTFKPEIKRSVQRELFSGDGRWLVNVFKGDWNGDGISDIITVSASGRVVVHEGGQHDEWLEPKQLLAQQTNIHGTTVDVRTGFVVADINHDGRDDIIFAEGSFNTSALSGTHSWHVLLSQPNGTAVKRRLDAIPSTTVTMSSGGQNEARFFFSFYNNIAIGIKPIIADLNGDKDSEILFPERASSSSDSFRWTEYSTQPAGPGNVSLSRNGVIPGIDVTEYNVSRVIRLVDDGTEVDPISWTT